MELIYRICDEFLNITEYILFLYLFLAKQIHKPDIRRIAYIACPILCLILFMALMPDTLICFLAVEIITVIILYLIFNISFFELLKSWLT